MDAPSPIPKPSPPLAAPGGPLARLIWCRAFEELGPELPDPVAAADFSGLRLRFRNDEVLEELGAEPRAVTDAHLLRAFGELRHPAGLPFLATRYIGHQFRMLNPDLGDGRGFLYGQVHARSGRLLDLGTKGSGPTPWSRGGDGRLTLKGGVRELLASETLHALGIPSNRTLCLVQTDDRLWRPDEPSPTAGSVLVRVSWGLIRFGTFERLAYTGRDDLIPALADHVIRHYYPHLRGRPDRHAALFAEVVERTARLVAGWVAAGFCHGVLNTDNMSITGEGFDYGPYAWIRTLDPAFTAAYFDGAGLYAYGRQAEACRWNLERLAETLGGLVPSRDLEAGLSRYWPAFRRAWRERKLAMIGLQPGEEAEDERLVGAVCDYLLRAQVPYHRFFHRLTTELAEAWWDGPAATFPDAPSAGGALDALRLAYHARLRRIPRGEAAAMRRRMREVNPAVPLLRPAIEAAWERIEREDDFSGVDELLARTTAPARWRSRAPHPCDDARAAAEACDPWVALAYRRDIPDAYGME